MWLDRIPASVAFCDVETTGLGKDDCIVSFGGIGMIRDELANGRSHLAYRYLVFDPGKRNHHGAEQVHGFSDWVLAVQDRFEVHAAQVRRFLTSYELLVAHNAASDFRFINREMASAGLSTLDSADLLHHERVPSAWPRRKRCSERRLQPYQARAFRSAARSDRRCLARHADLPLAARLSFPAQIAGFAASNSAQLPPRRGRQAVCPYF